VRVGVNYPWFDYGWDFGDAPPGWRAGRDPNWFAQIDAHLARFLDLGISVVRWFILGDGLTYGIYGSAPKLDKEKCEWRFDPPELGSSFREHFKMLLDRFENANAGVPRLLLLPVLVDFKICYPGAPIPKQVRENEARRKQSVAEPGWMKGQKLTVPDFDWIKAGRADIITDDAKREKFLKRVLLPLLEDSHEYRHLIYAWEIINEPDWVTTGWHPDRPSHDPLVVREEHMRKFIREAKTWILRAAFEPTVGFGRIDTIRKAAIFNKINQFHHYADCKRRLPFQSFGRYPAILGEIASGEDYWPELQKIGQKVCNRLKFVRKQGYPMVLIWSYRANDRHSSWSLDVEETIQKFVSIGIC
jgi:hypothetical protein